MKTLLLAFCLVGLCLLGLTSIGSDAEAAELTLQQIRSGSSRSQAMSYHQKVQRAKPSPGKLKQLEQTANSLRVLLRGPQARVSADQQWANLIAPVNRCTDLVRKVCGAGKECGDRGACSAAVQVLKLYNSQPTQEAKYEFESTCITALSDNVVFPACQ